MGGHRGRIQVQGTDMSPELSRKWVQSVPRAAQAALVDCADLWTSCNSAQQHQRTLAFKKARRFITQCSKYGGIGPTKMSFKDPSARRKPKSARVDIEVNRGHAFP